MTDMKSLEAQLKRIGCNFRFWGRAELRELANVLLPGETVEHCVNGQYEGGFAMLCATDQRVLLIDKKPMYLTLEDIRFDMVSELDYNHRLINATLYVCTPNKSLRFLSYNHGRLRQLFNFTQHRVMEIRQHYQQQSKMWKEYADSLETDPAAPIIAPATPPLAEQTATNASDQPVAAIPATAEAGTATDPAIIPRPEQAQPTRKSRPAFPMPAPIISAYTRLPMMSRQRRFLGQRAINSPISSIYPQETL